MAADRPLRNDPAMEEVLASIRRIVREEEARVAAGAAPPGAQGDILELTEAMRIDRPGGARPDAGADGETHRAGAAPSAPPPYAEPRHAPAPAPAAAAPAAPMRDAEPVAAPRPERREEGFQHSLDDLGLDEAAVAEIARAVLREELDGALGERISARLRDLVREEIARVVEELAGDG